MNAACSDKILAMILAIVTSFRHLGGWAVSTFRSREDLILENLALRQQLMALHSKRPRRRLTALHKLFWVLLRGLWSEWERPLILVTPRTVVGWHRAGLRLYWTWVSRARRMGGRRRVARNVQHIFDFLAATSAGTPASQLAMTTHPKLVGFTSVAKSSPLTLSYWSQTPYKLRDGAVKYVASPSEGQQTPAIELTQSPDALREAMIEQLTFRKIGTQFDFCVNQQSDATAMPIEDPTVEWTSPPCKLATVSIYPQKFDSSEQMSFVENLTWNPWNSLPAHSPLGGINRARRSLYIDSQQLRHKMNGIQPGLPTGRESF